MYLCIVGGLCLMMNAKVICSLLSFRGDHMHVLIASATSHGLKHLSYYQKRFPVIMHAFLHNNMNYGFVNVYKKILYHWKQKVKCYSSRMVYFRQTFWLLTALKGFSGFPKLSLQPRMLILEDLKPQASGLTSWLIEAPLIDAGMRYINGSHQLYFTASHCSCLTRALEENELGAINIKGWNSFH